MARVVAPFACRLEGSDALSHHHCWGSRLPNVGYGDVALVRQSNVLLKALGDLDCQLIRDDRPDPIVGRVVCQIVS